MFIPAALFGAHSTLAIPHGNASDLVSAGKVAGEVAFETVCNIGAWLQLYLLRSVLRHLVR